jgi:hypothetical protein
MVYVIVCVIVREEDATPQRLLELQAEKQQARIPHDLDAGVPISVCRVAYATETLTINFALSALIL